MSKILYAIRLSITVMHRPIPTASAPAEMPSLREFEVLHAVLRHGTTAAAARALGITQPAISRGLG